MPYTEGVHDSPADTKDRLVRIGAKYQATPPSVADGDNAYLLVDSAGRLLNANVLFNGASSDLERGNTEVTVLASAARTATTNSADLTNHNARGVLVFLDVTVNPGGAETLLMSVEVKDPISGKYHNLEAGNANAFGGTTGDELIVVYPGSSLAEDGVDQAAEYPLGRTYRITITHSAGGTWNYSLGAQLVL